MLQLRFSAVEHGWLPILIRILNIPASQVKVEEVYGKANLELVKDDGQVLSHPLAILPALHAERSDNLGMEVGAEWLEFAHRTLPLLDSSDASGLFAPLQQALAGRVYLAGQLQPSLADWYLWLRIQSRIRGMSVSLVRLYYRLVRWSARMHQCYLERNIEAHGVELFKPLDILALEKALSDKEGLIDKKEGAKDKKEGGKDKSGKDKPGKNKEARQEEPAKDSMHPFARVDIRVGKIVRVEKHPTADRLYVEQVDLGEEATRQVVSGLVGAVELSELQDRLCLFICNLKPAMLCKTLSSAMLLVVKDVDGGLKLLSPPAGAQPGDRVILPGVESQPDAEIKPKENTWEAVRSLLVAKQGAVYFEGQQLEIAGDKGFIQAALDGTIH